MITLNKQELINYFGVSESTINTNFPKFCMKQLAKGYQITKRGKGNNAMFDIEQVEPQHKDKQEFSSRKLEYAINKENEIWVDVYFDNNYQVSNLGRIKDKKTNILHQGSINKEGYHIVSIKNINYRVHRIVKQSFDPIENFEEMTVDHLNGIRSDNRLENLVWVSMEENTELMIMNRADLNKELTRLIQKYGYDTTLVKLQEF